MGDKSKTGISDGPLESSQGKQNLGKEGTRQDHGTLTDQGSRKAIQKPLGEKFGHEKSNPERVR